MPATPNSNLPPSRNHVYSSNILSQNYPDTGGLHTATIKSSELFALGLVWLDLRPRFDSVAAYVCLDLPHDFRVLGGDIILLAYVTAEVIQFERHV